MDKVQVDGRAVAVGAQIADHFAGFEAVTVADIAYKAYELGEPMARELADLLHDRLPSYAKAIEGRAERLKHWYNSGDKVIIARGASGQSVHLTRADLIKPWLSDGVMRELNAVNDMYHRRARKVWVHLEQVTIVNDTAGTFDGVTRTHEDTYALTLIAHAVRQVTAEQARRVRTGKA